MKINLLFLLLLKLKNICTFFFFKTNHRSHLTYLIFTKNSIVALNLIIFHGK